MTTNDTVAFIHPSAGIMIGTVIDSDPLAEFVAVDVPGEPFFRRIPSWMLRVIPKMVRPILTQATVPGSRHCIPVA